MDDATISAARLGNREAQARLLRELQDPWFRFCQSFLRDAELARDATQETALRFLRQLPGFRGDSQLRTWAMGIALNVVRELRRSKRPTMTLEEEFGDAVADRGQAPPHLPLESAEQLSRLYALLDSLPSRQREAVVLRYLEEMSTEETAVAMNCAVGTVKATLHQALKSLHRGLKALVL